MSLASVAKKVGPPDESRAIIPLLVFAISVCILFAAFAANDMLLSFIMFLIAAIASLNDVEDWAWTIRKPVAVVNLYSARRVSPMGSGATP